MQPSSVRQICRSRNPFTPSIVLRQYFVLATPSVRSHQRFSSSTSQTIDSNKTASFENDSSPVSAGEAGKDGVPSPKATKLRNSKSHDAYNKPRTSRTPAGPQWKRHLAPLPSPSAPGPEQKDIMMKAQGAVEGLEDYTGVVVEPATFAQSRLGSRIERTDDAKLPWSLHRDELSLSGHERLSSEIAKFHIYATPSRPEGLARKHAVEQIQSHVRELVPNFILEVFGSERTGLSLATSDIDLRLVTPEIAVDTQGSLRPPPRQQRLELVDKLYKLRNHLQRKNQYFLCAIRYSRYPLLSFQDRASGLDVQIVLSNDTSSARAAVSKYLKEYSYLAEVYTVVKSMFDIRGLSDVFRGGFGGYSIFMMVVASLQLNAPIKADAAHGLLSFLQFWSTFDTTQKGISVEPSELFDKDETVVMGGRAKSLLEHGKIKRTSPFMLCLRDPADPTNDLGRKGASIKHVQATCKHLLHTLQSNLDAPNVQTLLKEIVGPVYDLHMKRREKLETQGKNVLSQVQTSLAAKAREIREMEKELETEKASEVPNATANSAT